MVVWALCHNCGFACQQRVLKMFPGPGYLRSEDGVVWLWHPLVNLYIYICYWVLLFLLQLLWIRLRVSHVPNHLTHWSCDHVICKTSFISTFARKMATNFSKVRCKLSWLKPSSHMTHLPHDHVILAKRCIASFTTSMTFKLDRVMS